MWLGNATKEQKALDAIIVDIFLLVTLCSILADNVSIAGNFYIKAENLEGTEQQILHACSAQCHLINKIILLRSEFQLP